MKNITLKTILASKILSSFFIKKWRRKQITLIPFGCDRLIFIFLTVLLFSCGKQSETLTVYLPSNYSWLFNDGFINAFERENNVKVKPVYFTGASTIVVRLMLERNNPAADVVMGLNQVSFLEAKKNNLLFQYKPLNCDKIKSPGNVISEDYYAVMFDYGALAFIYNPEKIKIPLHRFQDILKLKKAFVFSDPRTSTTGQDFLLWTIAVYGDNWKDYWKSLAGSILTVAPDWDSAFAKFETSEASIMLSYASDEAYSMYKYGTDRYKTFIPSEGGFMEMEANAIVRKEKIDPRAMKFIEFCLSDEVQKAIPLNNWMKPVTNVPLPEVFIKYYREPAVYLSVPDSEILSNMDSWLREWTQIMVSK